MVLQRAGHDLGCRRRAAVHENDDAGAVEYVAAARRAREARVDRTAVRRDDHARVEKQVGHVDRRIEHAAGVVTQVENQAVEHAARCVLQVVNRAAHLARGVLAELADAYVAIGRGQELAVHARHANNAAAHRVIDRLAVAHDRDRHARTGLATQLRDRLAQVAGVERRAVNRDDLVAAAQARACRR